MVKIFLVNKNVLLDLSYMFLLRIYKEEMWVQFTTDISFFLLTK